MANSRHNGGMPVPRTPSAIAVPRTAGERMLAAYDRFLRWLGGLSATALLALPVLVAGDVLIRNVSGHALPWHDDVCEYLLYGSTMLGAPWLLHLGRHVRIDLLPGMLTGQASRMLELGINVFMLGVCLVLVFHAGQAMANALQFQTQIYKSLALPVWPFIGLFMASFCLVSLELVIRIFTGRGPIEDAAHGL